jgi:hypothetical protein
MAEEVYNFYDKETKKNLEKFQKKYEHWAERESAEGNETERHLSGQLILLTTVLITVNVLVLGDGNIVNVKPINTHHLNYIFFALISEILATFFGVLNYIQIEKYYDKNAGIWGACAQIVFKRDYKSPTELDSKLSKEHAKIKERKKTILYSQIFFILLSLILYAALIHSIFYPKTVVLKPHPATHHTSSTHLSKT